MGFKRLLIAALVLAGLGGALLWSDKQEKANEGKPAKDAPPQILALKEDTIQQVEIKPRTGDGVVVKKTGGEWKITAPRQLPADSAAVMAVVGGVTNLNSERLVDENANDLAAYGLEPAVTTVTFTQTDGKTRVLRIGDASPTGTSVYAFADGSKKLYTMASTLKQTFSKSVGDLRDKRLLIFDQEKLSRVELSSGKGSLEFGRTGQNEWQLLKPRPLRADGWQVEEILTKLKQVSLSPDIDEKTSAAAFASAAPVATLRVTGPDGTKSIEIRKSKDDVYAKASGMEGAYKVGKDAAEGLDKAMDDFRAKKVFDFGFNDPTKIEAKNGAKSIVVEKSADKWKSGGKAMDSVSIQNLIDKLRDLSAAKFADSGFTTAAIELTVVSNDGKRIEKVQIAQIGERFLAKRESDTTLYELSKDAASDLRQSIDGVHEATPASDSKKK